MNKTYIVIKNNETLFLDTLLDIALVCGVLIDAKGVVTLKEYGVVNPSYRMDEWTWEEAMRDFARCYLRKYYPIYKGEPI